MFLRHLFSYLVFLLLKSSSLKKSSISGSSYRSQSYSSSSDMFFSFPGIILFYQKVLLLENILFLFPWTQWLISLVLSPMLLWILSNAPHYWTILLVYYSVSYSSLFLAFSRLQINCLSHELLMLRSSLSHVIAIFSQVVNVPTLSFWLKFFWPISLLSMNLSTGLSSHYKSYENPILPGTSGLSYWSLSPTIMQILYLNSFALKTRQVYRLLYPSVVIISLIRYHSLLGISYRLQCLYSSPSVPLLFARRFISLMLLEPLFSPIILCFIAIVLYYPLKNRAIFRHPSGWIWLLLMNPSENLVFAG